MRRLLQPKNIMVSAHARTKEYDKSKYISILNVIQVCSAPHPSWDSSHVTYIACRLQAEQKGHSHYCIASAFCQIAWLCRRFFVIPHCKSFAKSCAEGMPCILMHPGASRRELHLLARLQAWLSYCMATVGIPTDRQPLSCDPQLPSPLSPRQPPLARPGAETAMSVAA